MAAFHVETVYYVPHQDLVAFAGHMVSGFVRPGFQIDVPRELKGPGWTPIVDVQRVPFADGRIRLALLLPYNSFADHQLMEFGDLEGKPLQVRPT